jgi:DNA-directed RNA polymerase specialized sigma24 family protein
MNSQDENELLHLLASGDQKALTSIYLQFWKPLFISVYNILKDKRPCENIIQEIFLQLWLNRGNLQVQLSLKDYLLAATRKQVFQYISKTPERKDFSRQLPARGVQGSRELPCGRLPSLPIGRTGHGILRDSSGSRGR